MGLWKWVGIFGILLLFILSFLAYQKFKKPDEKVFPPPQNVNVEGKSKVKYPQDYTLVLVGDSMTEYLGNSTELKAYLQEYYPDKSFEVLNYGFGGTSILNLNERLTNTTFYQREFRPITDIDFDVILVESFGNNPLSQYPLEEGLRKQEVELKKAVETLRRENPKAKIVFIATIAPSKAHYARGSRDLSDEERKKWAEERLEYMLNHIKFAKENNIPLINILSESLVDEDANLDYLSDKDYIHPSPNGVIFISQKIADFLFEEKILE